VVCDERIEPLDRACETRCGLRDPAVAECVEQIDPCAAAGRDRPLGPGEVPRGEALLLRQRRKERRCGVVLERQEGQPPLSVDCRDGPRREAAEPSASVVQEHRSAHAHVCILPLGPSLD